MSKNIDAYPIAMVLADTHCGKDTVEAFKLNMHEAISICQDKSIKYIFFAGDLVLSRAAQTLDILLAIHDVLEACKEAGIEVVMINGNHCKVNQESPRGYCNVFDSFSNVIVVDTYLKFPILKDVQIGLISYFPEQGTFVQKLKELEEVMFDGTKAFRILIIHEGIRGGLGEATETELPAKLFSKWNKVLVGHYHNRNTIAPNIEYIGSSRQHNFGEDEEKGYTVIYTDGSHEFIKNKVNTRYRVIDVSAERAGLNLMDELREIDADGRYKVKVRVHAPQAAMKSVDKAALLDAGATKVELIADDEEMLEVAASSLFEKFDSHRIRETYEEFCREKQIDDVAIGLEYLSKIEGQCGN